MFSHASDKMMDINLSKAKDVLCFGDYTCVLCKGDTVVTSTRRGVAPLVAFIESKQSYKGFSAADKVVGKATAFLYVLIGVKSIYARVISKSALQVLTENQIIVHYDNLVENIINRQGNDICPFEKTVLDITNPATAYENILNKIHEMNIEI